MGSSDVYTCVYHDMIHEYDAYIHIYIYSCVMRRGVGDLPIYQVYIYCRLNCVHVGGPDVSCGRCATQAPMAFYTFTNQMTICTLSAISGSR